MRPNYFSVHVVDRLPAATTERGSESPGPDSGKPPILYLKCWEMDYPYLRGGDQHKRWLPAVVDSAPRI